jgi:drug/metabolite transporter (DMT)-like permease
MRSLAGTASMLAGFYAISHSGGMGAAGRLAEVVTILNMYPLWVVALSWPLVGIPAKPSLWIGVLSGILGYAVISASDMAGSHTAAFPHADDRAWNPAIRFDATFVSAAFASLGSSVALIGLHKTRGVHPLAIVVHFSCVATLIGLVAAWLATAFGFAESKALPREVAPYLWLFSVGACATLGQVCLTMAFTHGNPGPVSAIGLTQAVFTALLEMTIYGRGFSLLSILGIALVMAPTAWVMLQERSSPRVPKSPAHSD